MIWNPLVPCVPFYDIMTDQTVPRSYAYLAWHYVRFSKIWIKIQTISWLITVAYLLFGYDKVDWYLREKPRQERLARWRVESEQRIKSLRQKLEAKQDEASF